jgi:hypothetical protein
MNVGLGVDEVQNLLQGLLALVSTLVPEGELAELTELERTAEADLQSAVPTGEHPRRFAEKVRSIAQASGQAALASVVDASVKQLLLLLAQHFPH